MQHHFDIDIAVKYGLSEAIILNNLWFWVKKNEANDVHYHDGEYWTYNSIKAMGTLHPYLSEKKIRNAINHLKDEGILLIGNYNQSPYDRTTWYAFTQKGKSIMTKGQIEEPETANGSEQKGEPIPDIKPIIKPDSKTIINTEFENLWSVYPKKQGKSVALKAYEKAKKNGTTAEEVLKGIEAYKDYIHANNIPMQYVKMGSTFFSQRSWQDDWSMRLQGSGNPFLDMLGTEVFE